MVMVSMQAAVVSRVGHGNKKLHTVAVIIVLGRTRGSYSGIKFGVQKYHQLEVYCTVGCMHG